MAVLRTRPRRAPTRVALQVNGRPLEAELDVPVGMRRLDEILPAFRALDDRLVDQVTAEVEAAGARVSCAKGCAACCKAQPVPVTPPEALALARLVDRLPEPRRSAMRAAFAAAAQRLEQAGLAEMYLDRTQPITREQALAVARRYFDLRIACPFLVDDACSIYAERPFVCRQYLVTSPPELCADPLANPVAPTPTPARFASALLEVAERRLGTPQYTVPLVLALAYVARRGRELEMLFEARSLFAEMLSEVFGALVEPGPSRV